MSFRWDNCKNAIEKRIKHWNSVGVAAVGWRIAVDYRSSGCSVADQDVLVGTCFVNIHFFACKTTFHGPQAMIQRRLNGSSSWPLCVHSDLTIYRSGDGDRSWIYLSSWSVSLLQALQLLFLYEEFLQLWLPARIRIFIGKLSFTYSKRKSVWWPHND